MEIALALLIGFVSGMLNAICTGGGLVSIPGLLFLGVSPVSAIATTRLSVFSGGLLAIVRYRRGRSIRWKYIPGFLVIAVAGGLLGPRLLLLVDPQYIERIIGMLILAMLPLLFKGKGFGTVHRRSNRQHRLLGLVFLFLSVTYLAMFGAGAGILIVYTLIYFYGFTVTEANATGTVTGLATALTALVAYIQQGAVVFHLGVPLLIGAGLGGYAGASLALKEGVRWVKWILAAVMVLSGVKLLLF